MNSFLFALLTEIKVFTQGARKARAGDWLHVAVITREILVNRQLYNYFLFLRNRFYFCRRFFVDFFNGFVFRLKFVLANCTRFCIQFVQNRAFGTLFCRFLLPFFSLHVLKRSLTHFTLNCFLMIFESTHRTFFLLFWLLLCLPILFLYLFNWN